jgi:hypothetical protein
MKSHKGAQSGQAKFVAFELSEDFVLLCGFMFRDGEVHKKEVLYNKADIQDIVAEGGMEAFLRWTNDVFAYLFEGEDEKPVKTVDLGSDVKVIWPLIEQIAG